MRSVLCTVLIGLLCSVSAWAQSEAPTLDEKVDQAKQELGLSDESADLLKTALSVHDESQAAAKAAFDATLTELLGEESAARLNEAMNTRGRGGRQGGQRPEGERGERPEGERRGGRQGFQDMTPEEREAFMAERQQQRFTRALETAEIEASEELTAAYNTLNEARRTAGQELEADLGAVLSEEQVSQLRRMQRRWQRGNRGGNRQRRERAPEDEVY